VSSPPPSLSLSLSFSLYFSVSFSSGTFRTYIGATRRVIIVVIIVPQHYVRWDVPPPTCLSAPLFGVDEHRKVDNRRWRGRSTLPDLSVASLDCFAAPCVSREIRECRDTERERERERERRIRRVRRELESVSLHFTTLSRRYRDPSSFRFRDRFGEIRGLSSICVKMAR